MATMDFVVKVQSSSGGTVTLNSSPFEIRRPALRAGDRRETEVENRLEIRLTDGSVSANLDELRTLNDLLRDAHDRNQKHDKRIDPVYLVWKESASASEWRSEITDARADWLEETLTFGYWTGDTQFADIEIDRVNHWEGPEAQLGLTNPNGTANTSGLTVVTVNDGSGSGGSARYNYVDITGTAVLGDLPAATRLEITNNYAGTALPNLAQIFIGQNYTNPTTFDHWLEAEEATHSGTASAGTAYSGGTIVTVPITSGGSGSILLTWSIASAQLDAAEGGYFKAIIGFMEDAKLNVRYKLRISYNVSTLWETDWISLEGVTGFADIVVFQLPPWLPGLSSLEELDLELIGYQTTGTQINQEIDFLQITPVDGWRAMKAIAYSTPKDSRIVDDGINGYLYQDDGSGGSKVGLYVGYGRPIFLKPGVNQRLYFLLMRNAITGEQVDRSASIKLYYRPRRLSL